jgi:hypothetical protein
MTRIQVAVFLQRTAWSLLAGLVLGFIIHALLEFFGWLV